MDLNALLTGIAYVVAVAIYALLGWRLSARRLVVSPAARVPAMQFALFWIALAVITGIEAFESFFAAFAAPPLAVVLTATYVLILVLIVMLWALVGYLLYLFLGRTFLGPLSVVYAAYYVALLYFIVASTPDGVRTVLGAVSLVYATPLGGAFLGALFVILILPEFIGSILYFSLAFRTRERTVRYRVTLVSWSLILWFGLSSANIAQHLGGGLAAQIFARSIGLVAALVILAAYYPPAAFRRAFGVKSVDEVRGSAG